MKVETKRISISDTKTTEMRFVSADVNRSSAILVLPALGVAAISYNRLLLILAKAGYCCAAIDLQGQGNSSVSASRKSNYGYKDILTEDIPAAIQELERQFNKPIILLGHSLGGQLASLYSVIGDKRIKGIILCTSGSVYYKSWQGFEKLRVLFGSQFARIYARFGGYFPGKKFGFGDRTFQKLISDWGRQALTGKYKIAGADIDYETALAKVNIPILILHLNKDFLAPQNAVLHLQAKFKSAKIERHSIDNPLLNHFNWLKQPEEFVKWIIEWNMVLEN